MGRHGNGEENFLGRKGQTGEKLLLVASESGYKFLTAKKV